MTSICLLFPAMIPITRTLNRFCLLDSSTYSELPFSTAIRRLGEHTRVSISIMGLVFRKCTR